MGANTKILHKSAALSVRSHGKSTNKTKRNKMKLNKIHDKDKAKAANNAPERPGWSSGDMEK